MTSHLMKRALEMKADAERVIKLTAALRWFDGSMGENAPQDPGSKPRVITSTMWGSACVGYKEAMSLLEATINENMDHQMAITIADAQAEIATINAKWGTGEPEA